MRSFDLLCQSKCCDGCCKKGSQLKGRCADAGDIAQVKLPNITIKKTHLQIREGAQEMILGRLFQKPCPPRPPPNLGNQQVYVAKECTKFPD